MFVILLLIWSDGRLIQSVASPYQGNTAAGSTANLGNIFGIGCGSNTDLRFDKMIDKMMIDNMIDKMMIDNMIDRIVILISGLLVW
jgi:hypothetical protein